MSELLAYSLSFHLHYLIGHEQLNKPCCEPVSVYFMHNICVVTLLKTQSLFAIITKHAPSIRLVLYVHLLNPILRHYKKYNTKLL